MKEKELKRITLKDVDNKNKTIEIGEPLLSDGNFWVTSRIGDDVTANLKLDNKEVLKLRTFLKIYFKEVK